MILIRAVVLHAKYANSTNKTKANNMTPKEIRELRASLCLTQERFANLLGSTTVTINRWELGKTTPSRLYLRELESLSTGAVIKKL